MECTENNPRYNICLEPELWIFLRSEARKSGKSVDEVLNDIVTEAALEKFKNTVYKHDYWPYGNYRYPWYSSVTNSTTNKKSDDLNTFTTYLYNLEA